MTIPPAPGVAAAKGSAATTAEAQELASHLGNTMDALLALVDEETQLVRAGRLGDVARLAATKADLAYLYLADLGRIKASMGYLAQSHPKILAELRRRHEQFHCLLKINLTVLATAHAVAEGLVRGVAAELNAKASPQVYGASGRQSAPRANGGRPVAVSRSL